MVQSDFDALCKILCDEEVMRVAYESAFSIEEAQNWMNRHFKRYAEYGFGLWEVVLKETNFSKRNTPTYKLEFRGEG